jgi:hypothetical protein
MEMILLDLRSARWCWALAVLVGVGLVGTGSPLWAQGSSASPDEGGPESDTVGASDFFEAGLHPHGNGLFARGEGYHIRLLGYLQPTHMVRDPREGEAEVSNAFSLRRARLDLLAELGERHTIFLEFDGAPGVRTALVEAWIDWEVIESRMSVRAGKFIGRFSHENGRSSRAIDTVERYLALNSLFLLPALDTQTGLLLQGERLLGLPLTGSVGIYNGNGSAGSNVPEDNDRKEVQFRLDWELDPAWTGGDHLRIGIAHDRSSEEPQELRLLDHTFRAFALTDVTGDRTGLGGDVHWRSGGIDLRAEALRFHFDTPASGRARLEGGFVQPSWFVWGGESEGLQLVGRTEWSSVTDPARDRAESIHALTLGGNLFTAEGRSRLQVNAIFMKPRPAHPRVTPRPGARSCCRSGRSNFESPADLTG